MSKPVGKRILMLLENSRYPGDPRVRSEATSLTNAGFQVTVICPAGVGHSWYEVIDGVRAYRFPTPKAGTGMLGYAWEYGYCMVVTALISFWVFIRHGFDVIHAHNPPDLFVFIAAFYKIFGKKFVFDHHDLAPELYDARFAGPCNPVVRRLLIMFEKLSLRMADHVIATNESYKAVEIDRGNVPEHQITIVRNGPDLKRVRRLSPDEKLRSRACTIVGYLGVISDQDGMDYLLRALQKLITEVGRKDFFTVIIGQGAAFERSKVLATELEMDEHVWFTGYVPYDSDLLMSYLSAVDIFVEPAPSNAYTDRSTMIKLMEYMALARPIVAFDLPEHRFTSQEAALYAKANDELDFARQIETLMDDPERCDEMGLFGKRLAETALAWPFQEQNLLNVYRQLGCRPTPATVEQQPPHSTEQATSSYHVDPCSARSGGFATQKDS